MPLGDKRITVSELAGENESWRYGHVIVDEAQDLTPMQWRMVMRRVRGRSLTIVGRPGPAISVSGRPVGRRVTPLSWPMHTVRI